ncbi:MAG: hypothetical protein ACP5PB_06145 [Acidimicrobiales bacterium]
MALRLERRFRRSKVPAVTARFWYLKLLTTAMGEATSDYFVHHDNPELVVLVAAVVFALALWLQLRSPRYLVGTYWFAVVMVGVFGTMCADVVHVVLGVPYALSTTAFAVALATWFLAWYRVEGTLSIHTIVTTRRELFYWGAVVGTFALGTAAGDLAAFALHLGFRTAATIFLALFATPGTSFALTRRHPVLSFWSAYVLTRPLGASVADWLGFPRVTGGLGVGAGTTALASSALIAVGVLVSARIERHRP